MKKFSSTLIKQSFAQEGDFDSLIGSVEVPESVKTLNDNAGGPIGILLFISKMLQVVTVVASIWVVINVIFAAYIYLTGGGKADNHQKVNNILTNSFVGLLIIVSSYTFTGLIGLIFFGDATYIISPTIISE